MQNSCKSAIFNNVSNLPIKNPFEVIFHEFYTQFQKSGFQTMLLYLLNKISELREFRRNTLIPRWLAPSHNLHSFTILVNLIQSVILNIWFLLVACFLNLVVFVWHTQLQTAGWYFYILCCNQRQAVKKTPASVKKYFQTLVWNTWSNSALRIFPVLKIKSQKL